MVTALIMASGVGSRMGQDIPKQFLNINDKPVIIYTLLAFQNHPSVDKIAVVCLPGWTSVLEAYCKQFGITKLCKISEGGETVQESIRNGLESLIDICEKDDTVIIHDSVRPTISDHIITSVLAVASKYGCASSSLPYTEQIFKKRDEQSSCEYVPRETLIRVYTPMAYPYGELYAMYKEAFAKNIGIGPGTYANTLWVTMGKTLYFAAGSEKNIKLTTAEDVEIFKALLTAKKSEWMK